MKTCVLARMNVGREQVMLQLIVKDHRQLLALGLRLRCCKEYGLLPDELLAYVVCPEPGHGVFMFPRDDALATVEVIEAECQRLGMLWQQEAMTSECFDALRFVGLTSDVRCMWTLLEQFCPQ